MNKQPYTQRLVYAPDNETLLTVELLDGPERKTMYVTALYYTMTCMTRYAGRHHSSPFILHLLKYKSLTGLVHLSNVKKSSYISIVKPGCHLL